MCFYRNGLNCLMKTAAWIYTGSHSMFAEAIHSLADTVNQVCYFADHTLYKTSGSELL